MTAFWGLPLGVPAVILATAIYFVASFLQGSVGFGSALVASPLLMLLFPAFVPGPIILSSLVLGSLIAGREAVHVRLRPVALITGGRLIGSIAGAWLLAVLSQRDLTLVFGILLVVAVSASAVRLKAPITAATSSVAGVLSGIFGTVAGIGGVVIALLYQDEEPEVVRSHIGAVTIAGAVISAAAIARVGKLAATEFKLFVILLPGLIAGFTLSNRFKGRVNKRAVRAVILSVAGSAALWLVIRYFLVGA